MALTTLSSLTPSIKNSAEESASLCMCFSQRQISEEQLCCAMAVEPGTLKSRTFLLFFIFFFPPSWLLRIGWVLPISSFLKRCCDSQGIQFTVVKAHLIILSLIIIPRIIWSEVLWWLIGNVWIKGDLIRMAHLFKPLKHPSRNSCLLPNKVDQSHITPACCKLVGDLHSLTESRKKVYRDQEKKYKIASLS